MAFLDNLTKKAQAAAKEVTEKTKVAADTAKINLDIAAEQREIEKNYKTIGEWYVSEHHDDDVPEAIVDVVAAIAAAKQKITELEDSKPKKAEAPAADVIETTGETVDEAEPAATPSKKICPICGNASEGKFCPHCGAPMGE